jgi:hypothetical protein
MEQTVLILLFVRDRHTHKGDLDSSQGCFLRMLDLSPPEGRGAFRGGEEGCSEENPGRVEEWRTARKWKVAGSGLLEKGNRVRLTWESRGGTQQGQAEVRFRFR